MVHEEGKGYCLSSPDERDDREFIDVDADIHSVVNFNGDTDIPREYMMSAGMISSLYESTVWEEITGEESVSTISILFKTSEENIDILLLSKANLSTEIKKLHTDSTTKQSIINVVNSGTRAKRV